MAVRNPRAGMPARPRLFAPIAAIVGVLLLVGGVGVSQYTELLWFRETGFTSVFTTVLLTRALLFVGFGVLMATIVGANLVIAYRSRPAFRGMSLEQQNLERYRTAVEPFLLPVLLLVSGVLGVFAGLSAATRWQTWLLWRNATPFGETDAQFGRDISYYAMTYPFQRFLLGFLFSAVILSLLVAAATHYIFGGVRLQTPGEKTSPAARAHLSVLAGAIILLKAAAYYLDRFGLAFSLRGRVQGASYTDINAVLPAKNILIFIAIICALLFFANIVFRNFLLPGGALALLVVSSIAIGGIYPAYTQQFRVKPNEIERESEYIARNIEATRKAYSIDKVIPTPYRATATASQVELRDDQGTVPNARILDPNVLSDTFLQFQRLRSYFGFPKNLDIDRYDFGDGVKDYVVAARELNLAGLSGDQRNWINEHLVYTHGNGFVAAPANAVDQLGQPVFSVGQLPVRGPKGFKLDESRIYFGEGTTDYSVVNTGQPETDGPAGGEGDVSYSYEGKGGVVLSNPVRKLAYALKFREVNLLLSDALDADSRLQYIRTPRERVQKVAPFLQLDEDPYPAVIGGKITWIVDGYTTSAGYPYGQRTTLGQVTRDSQTVNGSRLPDQQVNYIRNSVKATVDAFSGEVKLYAFDNDDPILKTWSKAFGGNILQPTSAITPELRAHFRYPEDLFKVQRELLGRYHVLNAQEFFRGDDYWQIPGDPAAPAPTTGGGGGAADQPAPAGPLFQTQAAAQDQPPYYVVQQFPGTKAPTFSLTTSFVARRTPNLTAVASVSSDPEDYGNIRVLEVPDNQNIEGPGQIANRFGTDAQVRQDLLPLERGGGSTVIPGNLLTLPVGGGLLYIEPIYVRARQQNSFPTLQLVLAAFGNEVASAPTLAEALDKLFGEGGAPDPTPPPGSPTASPSPSSSPGSTPRPTAAPGVGQRGAIEDAQRAFTEGQEALRRGDFAAYGAAQARLKAALERLAGTAGATGAAGAAGAAGATGAAGAAGAAARSASPTASAAPAPAPSPSS